MKVYRNYIVLDNSVKLYDITNLAGAKWIPGYWEEFNKIKKSPHSRDLLPTLRKLLDCFVKENIHLSWAKYYIVLEIRQTFHLQYPSLICYSKASKSIIPALLNPAFLKNIILVPKAGITYFRNIDIIWNQITKVEEEDIGQFFLPEDVDTVNNFLNILNSPSFNESKLIKEISNRLDRWETIEVENINKRLYSYRIDKTLKYTFPVGRVGHKYITYYANLYLSKIGGLI